MAFKQKLAYQKPELTILERSRPEEAVLLACKHGGNPKHWGANSFFSGCRVYKYGDFSRCSGGACTGQGFS